MKKIFVVGIGPGQEESMTRQARAAIERSDIVVGYNLYVKLVEPLLQGKETASTPMKREVERCEIAVQYALKDKTVAMVCSGDAGVYGMAGILMEQASSHPDVEVEVVPGITAACSGAAVLGAPLIHDFAVISLSDLLTPWEKIEKRLRLAAEADFVICLYNPSSKKRGDYLRRACEDVLEHRSAATPCGWVKNIGRPGEEKKYCTLEELKEEEVDMFTTVFIGNSQTKMLGGRMVTPRGYRTEITE